MNMVTKLVTESTRFILELNVMSQSDFLMKVNGQIKTDTGRWTKNLHSSRRHTIPLLISQVIIKWHKNRIIN